MKRTFTWENLDIRFLHSIVYSEKTKASLRPKFEINEKLFLLPYMDQIAPLPDAHFVRRYRQEIMDHFFAGSTYLPSIIRALERRHYQGVRSRNMEDMLLCLKGLRLSSTVTTLILSELLRAGQSLSEEDVSIFRSPKSISLATSIARDLPLYDYQEEALAKLIDHFVTRDNRSGVLVMPTGSGKTRVATTFLLREMAARSYQVVWLTHRAMLIEQAADNIYLAAPVIRLKDPQKETFKMVCVSGQHATARALEKDDDVMIFSVQSLCRNLLFLQAVLKEKVLILVDEAHHTLAPSYRLIIDAIRRMRPSAKLLGLTATPVRLRDKDTQKLMTLFDNSVVYSVAMSALIAKGVLATPHFVRVDTNINFDTSISLDEKAYIQKWGELSPGTMERIGQMAERNELIVNTYMKGREEYGKTLIFALNATHCISLCEALQKKGVCCDYIYSAHPCNEEKISRFRSGELDVLVNINILTEGSDVPDIRTIFLTRPTESDVLLMQMIGRGMRGLGCGGTDTVNIVDFHDVWGSFACWLNPRFVFLEDASDMDGAPEGSARGETNTVPWAMIRELFDAVRTRALGTGQEDAVLPSGWYDAVDEDGLDRKILVFECQLDGYRRMWKERECFRTDSSLDGEWARDRFFGGFGWMPSVHDLQLLLDYYRLSGEMPHMYPLTGRKTVDAALVGKRLKEADAKLSDIDGEINRLYGEHGSMIDSIYGGLEAYGERVYDFIRYPEGMKPLGSRIDELPEESLILDRAPAYDLTELAREVVGEQFDGLYGEFPAISWTDRPVESYFGKYYWPLSGEPSEKDFIQINCLLNSRDVPRETVKFVLYHELLHRRIHGHTGEFRALERRYPNYTAHEHFLDFTFPKFDLRYAM